MYGIFNYIWDTFGVNVGKYSIHGASGILFKMFPEDMVSNMKLGSI